MPIDPDEPFLVFRREYWIKPGILEIEVRLDSWALPLYISVGDKTLVFKFLCVHIWLGSWTDPRFWEDYKMKNAS